MSWYSWTILVSLISKTLPHSVTLTAPVYFRTNQGKGSKSKASTIENVVVQLINRYSKSVISNYPSTSLETPVDLLYQQARGWNTHLLPTTTHQPPLSTQSLTIPSPTKTHHRSPTTRSFTTQYPAPTHLQHITHSFTTHIIHDPAANTFTTRHQPIDNPTPTNWQPIHQPFHSSHLSTHVRQ